MKQVTLPRFILFVTFLSTLISCRKDNDSKDEKKGAAPAAHIGASEKMTLPDAIIPTIEISGTTIKRVVTYYAEGVQKYKASPKAGDPTAFVWVLIAPDANLYDMSNAKVGTHGAGPFWQLSPADSIFAQHFSPARTAPSPDSESIDWLLLKPKTGTTPKGVFAEVNFIQRIATKGGKAPLTPPVKANDTVDVKYQAVYRFSKTVP